MERGQPALLVVDVQYDFLPGGALGVRDGDAILPKVNRAIELFERRGLPVLASRDWHPPVTRHFKAYGGAWPPHCVQGTKGARFHRDLKLPKSAIVVSKGMDPEEESYSAFQAFTKKGRDLESVLREFGVGELYIAGLATDYCVRASAIDAIKRGFRVRVLKDAIGGVDVKPGDSEQALKEMRAVGAQLLETKGIAKALPPAKGK